MKRRDEQICIRVAGPLRSSLEAEAAARGLGLSSLMRKILVDHAAAWNVRQADVIAAYETAGRASAEGAPR